MVVEEERGRRVLNIRLTGASNSELNLQERVAQQWRTTPGYPQMRLATQRANKHPWVMGAWSKHGLAPGDADAQGAACREFGQAGIVLSLRTATSRDRTFRASDAQNNWLVDLLSSNAWFPELLSSVELSLGRLRRKWP